MKIAFAVFLFVHGFAHLVGTLTTFGIEVEDTTGEATFLLSRFEPGGAVMRIMAFVWLAVAAAYVFGGVGVIKETGWALPVIIGATAVSTLLCFIWAKDVPFGWVANGIIVICLLVPALRDRVLPF